METRGNTKRKTFQSPKSISLSVRRTKKQDKDNEFKLIGQGSYGCIISPPISSDTQIVQIDFPYTQISQDDIGKFFKDVEGEGFIEYNEELNLYKILYSIDPNNNFTPRLKGALHINTRKIENDDFHSCMRFDSHFPSKIYEIILENSGVPCHKIVNKIHFNEFIQYFKNLITGFLHLQDKGYVHRDIKPDNLLYRNGKFTLIDFGLMCSAKELYDEKNHNILGSIYQSYPPEFLVAFILQDANKSGKYDINNKQDFQGILKKIIQEMTDFGLFDTKYINPKHVIVSDLENYKSGIEDFCNNIIDADMVKYSNVFNNKLALKSDVYALAFIISSIKRSISFDNHNQEQIIDNIISSCKQYNPNNRISMNELYVWFDKLSHNENYSGGSTVKKIIKPKRPRRKPIVLKRK